MNKNKKAIYFFLIWLFAYAGFAIISKVYQYIDPTFVVAGKGNVLHPVGFILLGCIALICIPLLCITNRHAKQEQQKILVVISYGLIVHHILWIVAYGVRLIFEIFGVS